MVFTKVRVADDGAVPKYCYNAAFLTPYLLDHYHVTRTTPGKVLRFAETTNFDSGWRHGHHDPAL